MEIVFILILLCFIGFSGFLLFRIGNWIFAKKQRKTIGLTILLTGIICIFLYKLFFQKMHFIQSKVYSNLYLIKYPNKDQKLVQQAIRIKIKEHLQTEHKTRKKLTYTGENGIYFYEYYKHSPWGLFQDAGTYYFIEHEEDLGGFVSEELGMYTQYRLAEFYYEPCKTDSTFYCGKVNYFNEGELSKVDSLYSLNSIKLNK